jgi:nicotinate-nucleotide adenylyltransferase
MCQLAFGSMDRVVVDSRELQRDGPTYTIDTLQALEQLYPQAQIYLVIGEDQAQALHTWHRIAEIRRAAIICVAIRAVPAGATGPYGDLIQILPDCRILQMPVSALSATEVRHKAALGHSVTPLVFEPVARYIEQHHLYQEA